MKDVIASISTALGVGAISIVRVSGEGSIFLVNSLFKGKDLNKVSSHTIHYGYIMDNEEKVDEVLVSVMKAPKTFTTEDVVEINCHGGIATTNRVLELLLIHGARLAEPGEFTKRAFLNGRINLLEAEAVMNLIQSKTNDARKLSIGHLSGKMTGMIQKFRQQLLELLANIEVNIDYPEYEDIEEVTIQMIQDRIRTIEEEINRIVKESEMGLLINNGIRVVIVGRPNVGKSSILNKLLRSEKAIVTDIAGTTRDIVEGSVVIGGVQLNFIDTAGIRETSDIVEKIGVERSYQEIEQSDLVVLVLNNNEPLNNEDFALLSEVRKKKHIVVINKNDLPAQLNIDFLDDEHVVFTNTVSQDGIDGLEEMIQKLFNLDEIRQNDYACLANLRQISLAKESIEILKDVQRALDEEMPVDMIEIDLKRIWEKLGDILGESYSEELIDQLFSQFCLGK